jgi:hypothetical protein
MSTRFHDDPARIEKALEISTFSGRYQLDTPGPGIEMPFFEDAQIRLQQWGANLCENVVDIENSLRGASKPLTRDGYVNKTPMPKFDREQYPKLNPFVEESRVSHPAWSYRDVDYKYSRWEEPWINPQNWQTIDYVSDTNLGTRILEKDQHQITVDSRQEPFHSWLPRNS